MNWFRKRATSALRQPALQDAALAAALLAGTLAMNDAGLILRKVNGVLPGGPWPAQLYLWWIATGMCVAAVLVRRRLPVVALTAAMVAVLAQLALAAGPVIADLAVPIALCTVAATRSRATSLAILGGCVLVAAGWLVYLDLNPPGRPVAVSHADREPARDEITAKPGVEAQHEVVETTAGGLVWPRGWGGFPVLGSVLVAGWAIGSNTRNRRAYLDQLTARARDLEHERDQRVALAAAAERSRITRELHDVVAHGLAAIVMQAQGGTAMLDKRPADTRTALATIVETGRASLAEMRQVLSTVGGVEEPAYPLPELDRLPQLVEHVRRSGTEVSTRVEGTARPLPPAVARTAYRIVQEALTNTMKHAGPDAKAQVVLAYEQNALRVEVTDDGTARPVPDGHGNGLGGMRERVHLLNGHLYTGRGTRGFVVRARIPVLEEHSA